MTIIPLPEPLVRVTASSLAAQRAAARYQLRLILLSFVCFNVLVVLYFHSAISSTTLSNTKCASSSSFSLNSHPHHNNAPSLRVKPSSAVNEASPTSSFSSWLQRYPHTPGARFVQLLQETLHVHPGAEGERIEACHQNNYALCFAGHRLYQQAIADQERLPPNSNPNKNNTGPTQLERAASLPHQPNWSVWNARRYPPVDHKRRLIQSLGTNSVCLPLLLAGVAVGNFGVVVELGTYLGMSSKCIGMGFNTTQRNESYYAFDFFGNDEFNYNAITKNMPWTKEYNPAFNSSAASYLWLWRMAMDDAYPSALAFPGSINATTLQPRVWHKQPIALLSVDSAKSWGAFRDQTAGIQRPYMLKRGALLALMDFHTVDTQIKLMYTGCLRQYLQPVYTSWCQGEQWIFVVLQTFSLGMVGACMQDYLGDDQTKPTEKQFEVMLQQAKEDLEFMDGLFGPTSDSLRYQRECLMEKIEKEVHDSEMHWKYLRVQ